MEIIVVGTGSIASLLVGDFIKAGHSVVAVVSRSLEKAQLFIQENKLISCNASDDISTTIEEYRNALVYLALPAATRSQHLKAALQYGTRILVEKPLMSSQEVKSMLLESSQFDCEIYEASHFLYTDRFIDLANRVSLEKEVHSISAKFHFPISDKTAVKFNTELEPFGALGDLGWYTIRQFIALTKVLDLPESCLGNLRIDEETGAIVGGEGMLNFGETTLFMSFGYDRTTVDQSLEIVTSGHTYNVVDPIIPYSNSFIYLDHSQRLSYFESKGFKPYEIVEHEFSTDFPPHVQMLDGIASRRVETISLEAMITMAIIEKITCEFTRNTKTIS